MKSYFLEIVLPSVKLPDKGTYNLIELSKILGVSKTTIYERRKEGKLKFTGNKENVNAVKIYRQELMNYFSEYDIADDEKW